MDNACTEESAHCTRPSPHFLVVDGLLHLDDLVHADVSLGQVLLRGEAVVVQAPELHDRVAVGAVRHVVLRCLGPRLRHAYGDDECEGELETRV